jgi:DNA (cytosine-5)-methyltransferase 1
VLISPYYGSGSGETCNSANDPLPTVTAKARFGMVVPVTHNDGSDRARDVDVDPLPTIDDGANRGELAFITAQHGERDGPGAARARRRPAGADDRGERPRRPDRRRAGIRHPLPDAGAARARRRHGLQHEEIPYEFAGTKTEQIKQIGNAVSVAKMRACVAALMADAAPKKKRGLNDIFPGDPYPVLSILADIRQRSVQAVHAGISRRDWWATEIAANELRDRIDELIIRLRRSPSPSEIK